MNDRIVVNPDRVILLKASQVAEILNIGLSKTYQLLKKGEIPSVRFNRTVRVRPCDLDEYIQRCWSGWNDS